MQMMFRLEIVGGFTLPTYASILTLQLNNKQGSGYWSVSQQTLG